MGDAASDLNHDPELPFAYLGPTGREVYARFRHRSDAEVFRERCNFGRVVDTTPKPKIPVDAEFIYYTSWSNSGAYARRIGHAENNVWETSNPISRVDEEDLLKRIGDAEVTVLVRKEDA